MIHSETLYDLTTLNGRPSRLGMRLCRPCLNNQRAICSSARRDRAARSRCPGRATREVARDSKPIGLPITFDLRPTPSALDDFTFPVRCGTGSRTCRTRNIAMCRHTGPATPSLAIIDQVRRRFPILPEAPNMKPRRQPSCFKIAGEVAKLLVMSTHRRRRRPTTGSRRMAIRSGHGVSPKRSAKPTARRNMPYFDLHGDNATLLASRRYCNATPCASATKSACTLPIFARGLSCWSDSRWAIGTQHLPMCRSIGVLLPPPGPGGVKKKTKAGAVGMANILGRNNIRSD